MPSIKLTIQRCRGIYTGGGKLNLNMTRTNIFVIRPDLNDSIDFAFRTLEGSAFQRTGALAANAFSPNEHLTLQFFILLPYNIL